MRVATFYLWIDATSNVFIYDVDEVFVVTWPAFSNKKLPIKLCSCAVFQGRCLADEGVLCPEQRCLVA